jgi:hypothetical protein
MAHFHLGSAMVHLGRTKRPRPPQPLSRSTRRSISRASGPRSSATTRTISPGASGHRRDARGGAPDEGANQVASVDPAG